LKNLALAATKLRKCCGVYFVADVFFCFIQTGRCVTLKSIPSKSINFVVSVIFETTMMFTHAILRKPASTMVHGITGANLGKPDHRLALKQHELYRHALEHFGLSLTVMEADEHHPDSVFIEDAAVVTKEFAVVARPGAPSRRGETGAVAQKLGELFDDTARIKPPALLDGGDVLQCGFTFFVGLSERTNRAGASQFADLVGRYGYTTLLVSVENMLHLKSGVSCLGEDTLLIAGDLMDEPLFANFQKIQVPDEEKYAANSLYMNGQVLIPEGYPVTAKMLKDRGYRVNPLPVSEYRKLDGGLSCLSLRY
jgi:dimethylargininase